MRRRNIASIFVVAIGFAAAAACSSSSGSSYPSGTTTPTPTATPDAGATTHAVTVDNFSFSPQTLTIKAGDTVTWTWVNGTHSVTSGTSCTPNGTFDSTVSTAPKTFTHTFNAAGTFDYFCMVHCSMGMTGTIVVQP